MADKSLYRCDFIWFAHAKRSSWWTDGFNAGFTPMEMHHITAMMVRQGIFEFHEETPYRYDSPVRCTLCGEDEEACNLLMHVRSEHEDEWDAIVSVILLTRDVVGSRKRVYNLK